MKRTKSELLSNTKDVKNSKFVDNNTLSIEYNNGTKAIRLHNTDVVTMKDNNFILNSGGWRTPTTKDRINKYSPASVWQTNGQWFVSGSLFYDGITINKEGKVISKVMQSDENKVNKMKKRIAKYCNFINKDNLPMPDNGDCWYCLMTTNGQSLGDATNNHEHLLSHLKEGYLHGSILVNAMRESGYKDQQIVFHYQLKLADTFKRSLRRYLQKRLIKDIAIK
jgi:hypothetical protein